MGIRRLGTVIPSRIIPLYTLTPRHLSNLDPLHPNNQTRKSPYPTSSHYLFPVFSRTLINTSSIPIPPRARHGYTEKHAFHQYHLTQGRWCHTAPLNKPLPSTPDGAGFSVTVIEKVMVHAEEPWNDHWLPFTNLDLLVPPFDAGSFFCYKKPSDGSFSTMVNSLKASLSKALALYPPLSGDIVWNADAGENQIHCNNQGVDFFEAVADVELKELNLNNPDESIEGKLMPTKTRGVIAVQVTELKCGAMVVGCKLDHRIVDGYSANMFISTWADLARSKTPSMLPSHERSYLKPRSPPVYSSSIDNMFCLFNPQMYLNNVPKFEDQDNLMVNRIFYIKGEQLQSLQQLASANGSKRSKLEAFTSFLWMTVARSMENAGKRDEVCNMTVVVDGRKRLSEGGGEEKERLMASQFGNILSMPYGSKKPLELNNMSLSDVATTVHEFLQTVNGKDHFLELIDWVEERRPQPLIAKAFSKGEMSIMISAGHRFQRMSDIDFGWGKAAFGSCHVPSERMDGFVMTLGSPTNNNDWVVYMHMPKKHINFIEAHESHVFKPLNANYLNI